MDNELIERARELSQAATPGPWTEGDDENGDWFIKVPDPGHNIFIGNLEDTCGICHANSAFIAASRELVPALVDALEAAQAENARLREAGSIMRDALARIAYYTEESRSKVTAQTAITQADSLEPRP